MKMKGHNKIVFVTQSEAMGLNIVELRLAFSIYNYYTTSISDAFVRNDKKIRKDKGISW